MRAPLRSLAGIALAAAASGAALAAPPALPRELRGRVSLEVTRCRPIGRDDALLEAELRVRARRRPVALAGVSCAAYDDAGAPFFPTPVAGRVALAPRETRRLTVRFAADATHRECGCTLLAERAAARAEGSDVDAAFDAWVERLGVEPPAPAAERPAAHDEAPPPPAAFAPPVLRYERMLAPDVPLRAEPRADAPVTGVAPPGARLAVDRIERGWKLARTPDGLSGWLPGDAASADVAAPERMAERLAPLHRALAPGASTSEALCDSLDRSALGDLVAAWRIHERAVYVRPLWHALAPEDHAAFRRWAEDCYSATRVIDALRGSEIPRARGAAR